MTRREWGSSEGSARKAVDDLAAGTDRASQYAARLQRTAYLIDLLPYHSEPRSQLVVIQSRRPKGVNDPITECHLCALQLARCHSLTQRVKLCAKLLAPLV